MEAIKLEEILPSKAEFTVGPHIIALRAANLEDGVWLRTRFGDEHAWRDIFAKREWDKLCTIAYRLMDQEARSKFLAQEGTGIDETGVKSEIRLTGPEVLLAKLKAQEGMPMLQAIAAAFVNSQPLARKAVEEALKKNITELKTAGPKSSTTSRRTTAGRSKKSGNSR
jgi:hypothetical protein